MPDIPTGQLIMGRMSRPIFPDATAHILTIQEQFNYYEARLNYPDVASGELFIRSEIGLWLLDNVGAQWVDWTVSLISYHGHRNAVQLAIRDETMALLTMMRWGRATL